MNKKRSLFFDTSLIYFVVITCFVAVRIISNLVQIENGVSNLLSLLIQIGFMLLIPFFMYKFMRKKKITEVLQDFHVKKINFKAIIIAIGIGIIVYFLNLAVASFFNIFIYSTGYDPSFGMATISSESYPLINFLGDIFITAMLPGICEEFCHRGLLVNGYKQISPKKTILLVGLLFGLMHLNIEQVFYATIIGMFLTFLVYLTDSIIPSIIIHFLNNAIGLYITFASYNNLPFGNFAKTLETTLSGNPLTTLGIIFLVVILLLGVLCFSTYLLLKQTRVKEFQFIAQQAFKNKQREELLKSFDLDVGEVNKEQGIGNDTATPQVIIGEPVFVNGRKNIMVDFNFNENNLMATNFKKPSLKDKAFLYGVIFIGVVITICTLIWGII